MIINHNMNAMNAHRNMSTNTVNAGKSMEKLSSGLRINRAGDDAAGLAISEKMRGQIRGLDQAGRNAQDGISMIQTAEGALNETHSILQRMRELSTQAANDTNTEVDRKEIQKEMNQLTSEINRIGNNTEFNTQKLLNGDKAGSSSNTGSANKFYQKATTALSDFDFSGGNSATITIGEDSVTLDSALSDIDGLFGALDGKFEGVTVVKGTDTITFASAKEISIGISGTGASKVAGINDGDKATEVAVKYSKATTALSDFDFSGGNSATITIGEDSVTLDSALSDIDGLFGALDGKFEGVTVVKGADTITFEAAEEISIGISGTGASKIAGINDGDKATSNVPAGLTLTSTPNSKGGAATLQIGANQNQSFTVEINDMRANALGLSGASGTDTDGLDDDVVGAKFASADNTDALTDKSLADENTDEYALDVTDSKKASAAIKVIDQAIASVSSERSKLGAYQNRLEHTIANLGTASENLTSAESRVRDVDMAKEMMNFSKNNILSQAAQAMLAQANQQPQGVLQLLR